MARGASDRSDGVLARRVAVGLVAIPMAVWLVLGAWDSLVGLPKDLAPTTSLPGIYAALARSGDLPGVVIEPVWWLLFWAAVLGVYLGLLWPAGTRRRARVVAMPLVSVIGIGLLILGGMGWFHWWSAFGIGNSVEVLDAACWRTMVFYASPFRRMVFRPRPQLTS